MTEANEEQVQQLEDCMFDALQALHQCIGVLKIVLAAEARSKTKIKPQGKAFIVEALNKAVNAHENFRKFVEGQPGEAE